MPFPQPIPYGWVAIASVIAVIATVVSYFPSMLSYWDVAILSCCILITLRRRGYFCWAGLDKPSSLQDEPFPFTAPEDGELQSGEQNLHPQHETIRANDFVALNILAATKQKARRDRLATRYVWKWRLVVANRGIERLRDTNRKAEAKQLQEHRINDEGAQGIEHAKSSEEPNSAPITPQQPEGLGSQVGSSPVLPTAPPETSAQANSLSTSPPDLPSSPPATIEDAPKPVPIQPRHGQRRDRANKGATEFHKGPAGKPSIPAWLANDLTQEGPTNAQGFQPSSPSWPTTRQRPQGGPKVPEQEQAEADDDANSLSGSRLAGMVFDKDGPAKVTKCPQDKDCTAQVCGKAHHGPFSDATKPFKPEEWCWHDRRCTRRNCDRWHSSPASVNRPTKS